MNQCQNQKLMHVTAELFSALICLFYYSFILIYFPIIYFAYLGEWGKLKNRENKYVTK